MKTRNITATLLIALIVICTFNVLTQSRFASTATNTHTITAIADSNGFVFPRGAVTVVQGGSTTFTIFPNTGYRISNVAIDGVSVGPVTSYTFDNVLKDHSLAAVFETDVTGPFTFSLWWVLLVIVVLALLTALLMFSSRRKNSKGRRNSKARRNSKPQQNTYEHFH